MVLAALASGCGGGEDASEGLARGADKARDASAYSTVQQAITTAALVRSETGSLGTGADDLARRLQARDRSRRYSSIPSTGPQQVQVLGGGQGPAILVVKSTSGAHLGGWTDGAATLYYRGEAPPPYSADRPSGEGWSETPLQ